MYRHMRAGGLLFSVLASHAVWPAGGLMNNRLMSEHTQSHEISVGTVELGRECKMLPDLSNMCYCRNEFIRTEC